MKQALAELSTPLNEEEMERLDNFLLDRIDDETDTEGKDEGVLNVSELDGLFTAIVSGPELVQPSQWLPAVWGDFEPIWESEKDFEDIFTLMMRQMNGISSTLMEQPETFEPIFMERQIKGKTYTIVDEWCEGYRRGVTLTKNLWSAGGDEIAELLVPILSFTATTNWLAHNLNDEGEVEIIQKTIVLNTRDIHAYWLERREEQTPVAEPLRQSGPKVGRNAPCPCGSGRKFKKCCLH